MSELSVERLKVYTPEDAAGIGKLMPILSDEFSGDPIPEEHLRGIINSPSHDQLVARAQGRIVGAATLSLIFGAGAQRKAWLEDFVSDPESGIKGVGQSLWDEMLVWCSERDTGLHFTSRASREAAHKFYLKNGAEIRDTTVFVKTVFEEEGNG
mgnify:CR=1 FL=1